EHGKPEIVFRERDKFDRHS
ncbi:rCG64443, partial [Rattus norvegicus]